MSYYRLISSQTYLPKSKKELTLYKHTKTIYNSQSLQQVSNFHLSAVSHTLCTVNVNTIFVVRYEVVTVMLLTFKIFWDVTLQAHLDCWNLKIKALWSFNMSVTIYQSMKCNIPEGLNLLLQLAASHTSHILLQAWFLYPLTDNTVYRDVVWIMLQ